MRLAFTQPSSLTAATSRSMLSTQHRLLDIRQPVSTARDYCSRDCLQQPGMCSLLGIQHLLYYSGSGTMKCSTDIHCQSISLLATGPVGDSSKAAVLVSTLISSKTHENNRETEGLLALSQVEAFAFFFFFLMGTSAGDAATSASAARFLLFFFLGGSATLICSSAVAQTYASLASWRCAGQGGAAYNSLTMHQPIGTRDMHLAFKEQPHQSWAQQSWQDKLACHRLSGSLTASMLAKGCTALAKCKPFSMHFRAEPLACCCHSCLCLHGSFSRCLISCHLLCCLSCCLSHNVRLLLLLLRFV